MNSAEANAATVPQLRHIGHVTQLFVDDKPFLALGGELGNSTASDPPKLEQALRTCRATHVNTVMLPVYWDLSEPLEGEFDFSLVRSAIDQARAQRLHLVLLWFGTWKNSMSCYTPSWMKRDTRRFPRVQQSNGQLEEIISPPSAAANDCDALALARLMRFVRQYDSVNHTVIMVQVENEIGMIPEPRDHSPAADRAYASDVPARLLTLATTGKLGPETESLWITAGRHQSGSWAQVFGSAAAGEEVFSAWQFSTYVERVASAAKREYPLPMYTNAALVRPGYLPGHYPSGGPLPHLMDVWRAGAPSLDLLSPDIYFPNFMDWADRYTRPGNALFIPEMALSRRASANAIYAIGHCSAIGCGPFAIESMPAEPHRLMGDCYRHLEGMSALILRAQQDATLLGLSPRVNFDWTLSDSESTGELAGVRFTATFDTPTIPQSSTSTTLPTLGTGQWDAPAGVPLGAAMIIKQSPDEFVVLGMGTTITFAAADGHGKIGIERVQEGEYNTHHHWIGARWLNGDQTHQGRHLHLEDGQWSVQRFRLYRY